MGNYLACNTLSYLVRQTFPPVDPDWHVTPLLARNHNDTSGSNDQEPTRSDWLIDNFVMLAPDVERRHVTTCAGDDVETDYVGRFYSGLQHLSERNINFYSRFDSALKISDIEKSGREAFLAGREALNKWTLGLFNFRQRNPTRNGRNDLARHRLPRTRRRASCRSTRPNWPIGRSTMAIMSTPWRSSNVSPESFGCESSPTVVRIRSPSRNSRLRGKRSTAGTARG